MGKSDLSWWIINRFSNLEMLHYFTQRLSKICVRYHLQPYSYFGHEDHSCCFRSWVSDDREMNYNNQDWPNSIEFDLVLVHVSLSKFDEKGEFIVSSEEEFPIDIGFELWSQYDTWQREGRRSSCVDSWIFRRIRSHLHSWLRQQNQNPSLLLNPHQFWNHLWWVLFRFTHFTLGKWTLYRILELQLEHLCLLKTFMPVKNI